jgi:hypothetical protein
VKDWVKILWLLLAGFAVVALLFLAVVFWALWHRKDDGSAEGDYEKPAEASAPQVIHPGN